MTVTAFAHEVGVLFTEAMSWLGDIGTAIANDGILLAFVAVSLVGLGVGLYRRMLNI